MKKIVLVIFTVFLIHVANAQEKTLQLSLKEAIDYALKNNYNTKIAKNDIKKGERNSLGDHR